MGVAYGAYHRTGRSKSRTDVTVDRCPMRDSEPRVPFVMLQATTLRLACDLLEREFGCWIANEVHTDAVLARARSGRTRSGHRLRHRGHPHRGRGPVESDHRPGRSRPVELSIMTNSAMLERLSLRTAP